MSNGPATSTHDHLVLALDVDLVPSARLARDRSRGSAPPRSGWAVRRRGPEVVGALPGFRLRRLFDLKLHDIPTTVQLAAGSWAPGVRYPTIHAMGGPVHARRGRRLPRGGGAAVRPSRRRWP